MPVLKGKPAKQEAVTCSAGEQSSASDVSLLPYTKELEHVKRKLLCSEHRLGPGDSNNRFCWVDTSQSNAPHYPLCTRDLQEWAMYLVRTLWCLLCLQAYHIMRLMNFSTMLEMWIIPALLYRIHPISTNFARHTRNDLRHRFTVCPPSFFRPSSTITSTSRLPSMTCVLLIVHSSDGKGETPPRLLNLSRGHMHFTWRVTKKPMKMNHRKMILAISLRASIFATLLCVSCSIWIS